MGPSALEELKGVLWGRTLGIVSRDSWLLLGFWIHSGGPSFYVTSHSIVLASRLRYAPVFLIYLSHTAKSVFLVGLATPQELSWLTPESSVPTSDWHIVST